MSESAQPYMALIEILKLVSFHAEMAADLLSVGREKDAHPHYERMGDWAGKAVEVFGVDDES